MVVNLANYRLTEMSNKKNVTSVRKYLSTSKPLLSRTDSDSYRSEGKTEKLFSPSFFNVKSRGQKYSDVNV